MRTSRAIVSRLESGSDVRLSTLEKYVAALGLQLELKAVGRTVRRDLNLGSSASAPSVAIELAVYRSP